jgi:hypothetical protein
MRAATAIQTTQLTAQAVVAVALVRLVQTLVQQAVAQAATAVQVQPLTALGHLQQARAFQVAMRVAAVRVAVLAVAA